MRVYSGSPALAGKELGLFQKICAEYCSMQQDDHTPVSHMISRHFHSWAPKLGLSLEKKHEYGQLNLQWKMYASTHFLLAARLEQELPVSYKATLSSCYKAKPKDQAQLTPFPISKPAVRAQSSAGVCSTPRKALHAPSETPDPPCRRHCHAWTCSRRPPLVCMDPPRANGQRQASPGKAQQAARGRGGGWHHAGSHACSAMLTSRPWSHPSASVGWWGLVPCS